MRWPWRLPPVPEPRLVLTPTERTARWGVHHGRPATDSCPLIVETTPGSGECVYCGSQVTPPSLS